MGLDDEEFWNTFRAELAAIEQEIGRLRTVLDPANPIHEYFLHRLMMACENATGADLLGSASLATPLTAVARALFESVIVTYWASLNDENATEAMTAAERELLRIMRNTITKGRANILHKTTREIENEAVLNHPMMKEGRRPKRFDEMAEEAGIKNIYDTFYGFLSLFAHGTASKIHMDAILSKGPPIYENMSLVRGCVKAISLISKNRIEGRQTDKSDLEKILKVKLTN